MKFNTARRYMQPYIIVDRRLTTINNAFASAIAPTEDYDDDRVKDAMKSLDQNPDKDLTCVYCGSAAETWDHVFPLVKKGQSDGYGHVLGNLVPCCKKCNSDKGGKNWRDFLKHKLAGRRELTLKENSLSAYLRRYLPVPLSNGDIRELCPSEMRRLDALRDEIVGHMREADEVAAVIRRKLNEHIKE